jgi:hypothetical protein
MTLIAVYLAIGVGVALFMRYERFVDTFRWWHLLTWPLIVVYFIVITFMFFMAQDRR